MCGKSIFKAFARLLIGSLLTIGLINTSYAADDKGKTLKSDSSSKSQIFTYDKGVKKTPGYLHVKLQGETQKGDAWIAKDVSLADVPFHQTLYSNPKIMENFGDGTARTPESVKENFTSVWIPRYAKGRPHGGFTIFDVNKNKVGHLLTGIASQPGVSQLSYLYSQDVWGQGLGTSVLESIVNDWAPEVRRIGLGKGLQESDASKVKAFRCFKGKPLQALEATARPANVPSWKILKRNGFVASLEGLDESNRIIDLSSSFEGVADDEIRNYELLEQHISNCYFNEKDPICATDKNYLLIDNRDQQFTLSYHQKYNSFRFHFNQEVKVS